MYLVIKGKLNLSNYFAIMVLSTIVFVGVVITTAFLPFDKLGTALLMALLSMVSLGSSMYVMKELLKPTE
jgi:hypothetical protein